MNRRETARLRHGAARRKILIAILVVGVCATAAWKFVPRKGFGADTDPLMHSVERSQFIHEIVERGTVESASNVEVRCEVQAKGAAGTQILEVIPEGTYVQPGEILVKLDSSALEADQTKQQIVCINSEAARLKAINDFEAAKIAKHEYEEGVYEQSIQAIQSEISTAQENLRRSRDYVKYSERLYARGYVTSLQLEADRFAVEKARTDEEVANTKLRVLRDYTRAKTIKTLETAIASSEAAMKATTENARLDQEQLARIDEQLAKCIIKATEAGQVVYANDAGHGGGGKGVIIQEGEIVRERQVLIRLPDPKRMQVKTKVNESRISLVAVGQSAGVRLDAFADMALEGSVDKVNEYPSPPPWFNPNVKEYEAVVNLPESPVGMRPGLTAEVRILIQEIPDAIQVPVQAIIERNGKHFCIVRSDDGDWQGCEVEIGPTNDKTVVIRGGLEEGRQIVLNAAPLRDKADLPEVEANAPMLAGQNGAKKSTADSPAALADRMFAEYDKDHDGRIELDAMPQPMRQQAATADGNRDGKLDRAEFNAVAEALIKADPLARTARKEK